NETYSQPDRWQQRVKYVMNVDVDVVTNRFTGKQQLEYTNNSPDTLKKNIDLNYSNRLGQLVTEQTGKQAPFFSLSDSTGRAYRITDYKGRLVFIDLWASWCLPCRLESPYLQKLVNKYNKRDIIFIGIAVGDNTVNWKKALKQDRPHWLQLFDRNAVVANAYAVKSVPRYVLISRAGNVVDFNAPPPSQPAKLIALIEKELKTQDN
ncbi:MAG TPA: redoxin family protein, partial [Flavitalea sp.]|nr:redoxin family protein [Flavitalea sp.]